MSQSNVNELTGKFGMILIWLLVLEMTASLLERPLLPGFMGLRDLVLVLLKGNLLVAQLCLENEEPCPLPLNVHTYLPRAGTTSVTGVVRLRAWALESGGHLSSLTWASNWGPR